LKFHLDVGREGLALWFFVVVLNVTLSRSDWWKQRVDGHGQGHVVFVVFFN